MQLERHTRIARIKKVSVYLGKILTFSFFFMFLADFGVPLFFVFIPTGPVGLSELMTTLGGSSANEMAAAAFSLIAQGLSISFKLGFCVYMVLSLFLFQLAIFHLRNLMAFYSSGEIFNKAAIIQAKKALFASVGLIVFHKFVEWFFFVFFLFHTKNGNTEGLEPLIEDSLGKLVFIGFLFISVWALEIGSDLNQESELTI